MILEMNINMTDITEKTEAIANAKQLVKELKGQELTFIGHSLGG